MITYQRGPFEAEDMNLCQWVEIGPDRRLERFKATVLWANSSESQILFMHGGKVLKEGATYTDTYGDSKTPALSEARAWIDRYGITAESSLSVVIKTAVRRQPFVRTDRCQQSDLQNTKRRHEVEYIPDPWLQEKDGLLVRLETVLVNQTFDLVSP
jgi:hypothetical protein